MLNTISPDYDITPLVSAMAEQAAKEAQRGDKSAALWLATDGVFMLDAVGMETAAHKLGELARAIVWRKTKQVKKK